MYRAPGRINLIGEHTDYNDGLVLPAALTLSCWVAAAPRADDTLAVFSETLGEARVWTRSAAGGPPARDWGDYVRGVALALRDAGHRVPGASLLVHSEVPLGAGLSSSAALEVAVGLALLDLAEDAVAPNELARICQRAENDFAGARCGVMDQMTALHAREGHAALIDCRSLAVSHHRLPAGTRLVACHSMVRHEHAAGEYNRRREECEAVVTELAPRAPHVRSLRDVDAEAFAAFAPGLPERLRRRARHVIGENARTAAAAAALDAGNLDALRPLMAESHRSLRDDFEVSCPELDRLVDLAAGVPGVFGSRLTGGGFGGCTVNLVAVGAVDDFCRHVGSGYEATTGRRPEFYVSDAGGGASRVC